MGESRRGEIKAQKKYETEIHQARLTLVDKLWRDSQAAEQLRLPVRHAQMLHQARYKWQLSGYVRI